MGRALGLRIGVWRVNWLGVRHIWCGFNRDIIDPVWRWIKDEIRISKNIISWRSRSNFRSSIVENSRWIIVNIRPLPEIPLLRILVWLLLQKYDTGVVHARSVRRGARARALRRLRVDVQVPLQLI